MFFLKRGIFLFVVVGLSLFVLSQRGFAATQETVCSEDYFSPCCTEWQKDLNSVDDDWYAWWDKALAKPINTSVLVKFSVSALRTYNCNLQAVCKDLSWSLSRVADRGSVVDENGKIPMKLIGCFNDTTQRSYKLFEYCDNVSTYMNARDIEDMMAACEAKTRMKFEEEKIFLKTMLSRDAMRKKAGMFKARIYSLLGRVRDELMDNVEEMVSIFDRVVSKIGCTIRQCD